MCYRAALDWQGVRVNASLCSLKIEEDKEDMPHLVMCGRYWRIGGDELPLPASFAIFGRIVWVVILIIIASKISYESTRCHEGIDAYLYLSAVIFFLSIIVEILIAWSGTLGNMIEVEVRAGRLQKFLIGHYALVSLQLIVILWGIAILSNTYNMPCTVLFQR